MVKRIGFATALGGFLAAASSAIGMGNIWRFPTQVGQNGGGAFLLVYLVVVLIFGLPLLIAEFIIGRRSKANVGKAFSVLAPNSNWKIVGLGCVFVAFMISCYYNVIVGWIVYYLIQSVDGSFLAMEAMHNDQVFVDNFMSFVTDPYKPIGCLAVILILLFIVIVLGVQKGIERMSKLLVPILFIILVLLAIFASTMDGASKGYEFFFKVNWSAITPNSVLSALGQCFYSFSIGMGLITYASYFKSSINLTKTAVSVAFLDTLIAVIAGLIIFPAVFSVSSAGPGDGPGLVFISLPKVFAAALSNSPILSIVIPLAFYITLLVAAFTSTLFLNEVSTAYIVEKTGASRAKTFTFIMICSAILGILASLSMGPLASYKLFGMGFFDFLDYVTSKIILPLTGIGISLFAGWRLSYVDFKDELTNGGTLKDKGISVLRFFLKFIVPILILTIMMTQLFNVSFA